MYRLVVFNVLAHNRDDHAKNISFIMDETGVWHIAPAYDLTFSNGTGGEHSTTLIGEGKNPTRKQLCLLGQKIGIKEIACKTILADVQNAIAQWPIIAKECGVNSANIKNIGSFVIKLKESGV